MTRELAVYFGDHTEAAVIEDGRLVEYLTNIGDDTSSGHVILGRVGRIVPGLNAAFVDIGESRDGFLPLQENSKTFSGGKLVSGSRVLVQIKKEAHGAKGSFLSRDISVSGKYVILMPMNRFIGVSAKLREMDPETAERMYETGKRIAPDGMGIVLRTAAPEADEEELRLEIGMLIKKWKSLREKASEMTAPSVLTGRDDPMAALLNDYLPRGIGRVYTNRPEQFRMYCGELENVTEEHADPFARDDLRGQLKAACERKVRLNHGGTLVFDVCEALTVIDVNTGADTHLNALARTDDEACTEIARQIRLRNLSGMILIDMIDPKDKQAAERILDLLKTELLKDRVKTVLHGITDLGIVEITRKRTGASLAESFGTVCACCGGRGWIPVKRGMVTDE